MESEVKMCDRCALYEAEYKCNTSREALCSRCTVKTLKKIEVYPLWEKVDKVMTVRAQIA